MTIGRCLAVIALSPGGIVPPEIIERLSRDTMLQPRFTSANLIVWAGADMPAIPLEPEAGIVIGTVFEGLFPARSIARFDAQQTGAILRSEGRDLHTHLWGRFVAFLRSATENEIRVVRDASPACPIYFTKLGTCLALATQVKDLERAGIAKPAIDLSYIAGHLQLRGFRSHRTALHGIEELGPGEHLVAGAGTHRREQGWSPWSFAARSTQIDDHRMAADLLEKTVDATVGAWATRYRHALLGVSGGLDSSIVAASLSRSDIGLTLLNLLSVEGSPGDERHFANVLGAGLGKEIRLATEAIANIDIRRSDAAHLPRPLSRAFSQSGSRNVEDLTAESGTDVVFSGGGGDNVFCYIQSSAPVADRLLCHAGPGKIFETVRDVSRLSGDGAPRVVRSALKRRGRRHPAYMWKPDFSFLGDAYQTAEFDVRCHPWLMPSSGRLPGKLEHIGLLVLISNFTEGFGYERKYPVLYPLLSQPVVELCLRIPSWMWCRNGVNRAPARDAFRHRLPLEIIQRTTKGSFDRLAIELIERRTQEIEEFLCSGFLSDAGLIKSDDVRRVIQRRAAYSELIWARILALVDVEAWCRSWA
ncbi:MAG: asparagine synthase-related protein [Candidatus Sphingomonas colombiensis]|nr:asparagine synthetase B family protein [Sphingomonas sp.]WEK43258.1 MAG: asparagine synthase-related protein [Sphingomonas sp.]